MDWDLFERKEKNKENKKRKKDVVLRTVKYKIAQIFKKYGLRVTDVSFDIDKNDFINDESESDVNYYNITTISFVDNAGETNQIIVARMEDCTLPFLIYNNIVESSIQFDDDEYAYYCDEFAQYPNMWNYIYYSNTDYPNVYNNYDGFIETKNKRYSYTLVDLFQFLNHHRVHINGNSKNCYYCENIVNKFTNNDSESYCAYAHYLYLDSLYLGAPQTDTPRGITMEQIYNQYNDYKKMMQIIRENRIVSLYAMTKSHYKNTHTHRDRQTALFILLAKKLDKNSYFKIFPKDIVLIIAKKIFF